MSDVVFVTTHFNPLRYKRLKRTYYEWVETLAPFVREKLVCYELLFDGAKPEIEDSIELHGTKRDNLIWQKEALLNVALRDYPHVKYFAWLDHDMVFEQPLWYFDAIDLIDKGHCAVQLMSQVTFLGPQGNKVGSTPVAMKGRGLGNPGGMWMGSREYLEMIDGFYPYSIIGGGDRIFYIISTSEANVRNYRLYYRFRTNFERKFFVPHIRRMREVVNRSKFKDCTCLPGNVTHLFHGYLKDRQYMTRDRKLQAVGFSVDKHVKMEANGILGWVDPDSEVTSVVRNYFELRREDKLEELR